MRKHLELLLRVFKVFHMCMLSNVWSFVTPWTVALQAPLPMELSRQEYWSGSSRPRDWTRSCIGRWILYHWATWEALRGFRLTLNGMMIQITCHGLASFFLTGLGSGLFVMLRSWSHLVRLDIMLRCYIHCMIFPCLSEAMKDKNQKSSGEEYSPRVIIYWYNLHGATRKLGCIRGVWY